MTDVEVKIVRADESEVEGILELQDANQARNGGTCPPTSQAPVSLVEPENRL
ncbi:hypothetical protein [Geoanaerobacter pelophilus]|uniref:hypothetical protein n=1 Tax=Geoanaerobacter pelophilus TaxID=60036 RepID=UPI0013562DDF|nr:hypothetical protein [Geoanaerobacter pelophilus]